MSVPSHLGFSMSCLAPLGCWTEGSLDYTGFMNEVPGYSEIFELIVYELPLIVCDEGLR